MTHELIQCNCKNCINYIRLELLNYSKGAFKNYVDHFLPNFDHLPTCGLHFYYIGLLSNVDIWKTTYLTRLVNTLCSFWMSTICEQALFFSLSIFIPAFGLQWRKILPTYLRERDSTYISSRFDISPGHVHIQWIEFYHVFWIEFYPFFF